jgi:hypothetical protein
MAGNTPIRATRRPSGCDSVPEAEAREVRRTKPPIASGSAEVKRRSGGRCEVEIAGLRCSQDRGGSASPHWRMEAARPGNLGARGEQDARLRRPCHRLITGQVGVGQPLVHVAGNTYHWRDQLRRSRNDRRNAGTSLERVTLEARGDAPGLSSYVGRSDALRLHGGARGAHVSRNGSASRTVRRSVSGGECGASLQADAGGPRAEGAEDQGRTSPSGRR